MVTRDEIRLAYQFLLGREPEDEGCYIHHAVHADAAALGLSILRSEEAIYRLRVELREARRERSFQFFRPQIVFIHLEKVGGTSLYESLRTQFGPDGAAPPHLNCVPDCTMAELNDYDFVSGHFSYEEAMALPRSPKTFIIMFREPFARLISFYRFHRAHPDELRCDTMVSLAKDLSPEDFFRHASVRASPRINNAYLQCLAGCPGSEGLVAPMLMNGGLDIAYRRLDGIAAIGLTENIPDTIRLINAATGFSIPTEACRVNMTADLHKQRPDFKSVREVGLSPELRETIFPLVEQDLKIYAKATGLFQARLDILENGGLPPTAPTTRAAGILAAIAKPLSAAVPARLGGFRRLLRRA